MKGKITKKEKQNMLKTGIAGTGLFLIIFPFRDYLQGRLPIELQIVLGGALVYFALKRW